MAYGLLLRNSAGGTVLDTSYPALGRKAAFSVGHTSFNDGVYFFEAAGALALSGQEIAMVVPAASQWVAFSGFNHLGTKTGYLSNQPTLTGFKADLAPNLPAPVGYGAVIKTASGARTWASNIDTLFVTDGVFLDQSAYDPGWSAILTGNAVALTGGGYRAWFDTGRTEGLRASKFGTDSILLDYGYIQNPTAGAGSSGSVTYLGDVFAMAGVVT